MDRLFHLLGHSRDQRALHERGRGCFSYSGGRSAGFYGPIFLGNGKQYRILLGERIYNIQSIDEMGFKHNSRKIHTELSER